MKRHSELAFRKPETLSVGRASGMNLTVVDKWLVDFEKMLDDNGIKNMPSELWNCDESGLQDNFNIAKVIATVGQPCYQINAGEKGQTSTVCAA